MTLPVAPQQVQALARLVVGHQGEDLGHRAPAVQRRHGGLQQGDRAVHRAGVAPALQRVRQRQVPVRAGAGLVAVEAGAHLQLHPGERVGEAEVGRRVVGRVGVEHQQRLDLALAHGLHQAGEVLGRLRHRVGVEHGGAGVAQRRVQAMRRLLHRGRRRRPGQHDAAAARRQQRRRCPRPPLPGRRGIGRGGGAGGDVGQQALRQGGDLRGAGHQGVVRLHAGERGGGGDRMHRQQRAGFCGRAPRLDPVARDADLVRAGIEEVPIQRDDHLGALEAPAGLERAAIGAHGAGVERLAAHGGVRVPVHLGQRGAHGGELGGERGRGDGAGQHPQAAAALGAQGGELGDGAGAERRPGAGAAQLLHRLRAERVPQAEHRGLGEDVGAAAAPGVLVVALDLERAAVPGGDQHAVGEAVHQRGAGIGERLARLDALGVADVGHLLGAAVRHVVAAGEAGQRQRGGHQAEEAAPVGAVGQARGGGELGLQELPEGGRAGQRVQAAPQRGAGAPGQLAAQERQVSGGDGHARSPFGERADGPRRCGDMPLIGGRWSSRSAPRVRGCGTAPPAPRPGAPGRRPAATPCSRPRPWCARTAAGCGGS